MYVSDADLQRLTEYRQRHRIIQALEGMGINYTLSRTGKPLVLRSTIERLSSLSKTGD